MRVAWACCALGVTVGFVSAQTPSPSPLEVNVPAPTDAPIPYLETVVAPGGRCAVVSDVAGVLIVGHTTQPEGKETFLSVYKLDAQGKVPPATPAVPAAGDKPAQPMVPNKREIVPIKRPESLVKFPNYVGSMVAHPKLPLLYVWMDIQAPAVAKPEEDPVFKDMDRLVIFSIKDGVLTPLVQSTCRGPDFARSLSWHTLVMDPAATRLYISNIRKPASPTAVVPGVGVLMLDAAGMPARLGEGLNLTLHDVGAVSADLGFVHGNDETFIVTGASGPVTVDTANRRARYGMYTFNTSGAYTYRIAGHPAGDAFFMTAIGAPFVCMMDHSEGYISGLPRRIVIPGAAAQSLPVIVPKRNQVAFGGVNKVHVVSYNAAGRFEPRVEQAAVMSPAVAAICYSPKFDKLYAAVEAIPEAKP